MSGAITVINTTPYKLQPVPEVGKEYHIFDDGKINPNRHSTAIIIEIIPFNKCEDTELIELWYREVADCYWLYETETDYFVKAYCPKDDPMYFVRTKDGGWFSLGWWASRLDIDGSLYEQMKEWYNVEG